MTLLTCDTCHFPHGDYGSIENALKVFGRGFPMDCENAAKTGIMALADGLLKAMTGSAPTPSSANLCSTTDCGRPAVDRGPGGEPRPLQCSACWRAYNVGYNTAGAKRQNEVDDLKQALAEAVAHGSRESNKVIGLVTDLEKLRQERNLARANAVNETAPAKPKKLAAKKSPSKRKR